MLEGLARYVELESWRIAATSSHQPVPERADLADFQRYSSWGKRWPQDIELMTGMAADQDDGRFYYADMARAFLLDRLLPNWTPRAAGAGVVWLETLLAEAVVAG